MRKDGLKKMYYSIREVADLTGIEPHVLRFWEKEFSMLRPRRRRSGNRVYRERDIQIILAIKDLRDNHKYTIQGAVERLKMDRSLWENRSLEPGSDAEPDPGDNLVSDLKAMLVELRDLIQGNGGSG